jgi:hypothetical protein
MTSGTCNSRGNEKFIKHFGRKISREENNLINLSVNKMIILKLAFEKYVLKMWWA